MILTVCYSLFSLVFTWIPLLPTTFTVVSIVTILLRLLSLQAMQITENTVNVLLQNWYCVLSCASVMMVGWDRSSNCHQTSKRLHFTTKINADGIRANYVRKPVSQTKFRGGIYYNTFVNKRKFDLSLVTWNDGFFSRAPNKMKNVVSSYILKYWLDFCHFCRWKVTV